MLKVGMVLVVVYLRQITLHAKQKRQTLMGATPHPQKQKKVINSSFQCTIETLITPDFSGFICFNPLKNPLHCGDLL
jgi:hypothetical protein